MCDSVRKREREEGRETVKLVVLKGYTWRTSSLGTWHMAVKTVCFLLGLSGFNGWWAEIWREFRQKFRKWALASLKAHGTLSFNLYEVVKSAFLGLSRYNAFGPRYDGNLAQNQNVGIGPFFL